MNESEIRTRVVGVIKSVAPEVEEGELRADRPLRDQIDLDSMDWLNVLVALHEKLRVDIPEADYGKLVTLDDLVGYLRDKLAQRAA
ncbi:MAG TPA: acyl carrier protein [Burkholderiales bacterium]|nr:acyl carrier protein [Burkholderiales bacterium]